MAENNIMALVGAFIGIAIILGIGIQILGNSVQDCSTLDGYHSTNSTNGPFDNGTNAPLDTSTGWALQCENSNTQAQNAYTLLVIILIVVAAVAILSVIRMLG